MTELRVYRMRDTDLARIGVFKLGDEITIWEWIPDDTWNAMKGHQSYHPPANVSPADIQDPLTFNDEWDIVRVKLLNSELLAYLVNPPDKEKKTGVWYCHSKCCVHRENDLGYKCYWCGLSEGKE